MSFSVNTNANALVAIQTLSMTNKGLSEVQNRINSGYRVSGAVDDASTFAIAQGMRADISALMSVSDTLALGQSVVAVGVKGSEQISDILTKIKAKVIQADADGVDRTAIQNDIEQFLSQIDAIASSATFNGKNLLNTGASDLTVRGSLGTDTVVAPASILTSATLGIAGVNVEGGTQEITYVGTWTVADGDTISFTAGGQTYTFEFIDDPSTTAPANGDNIVVNYDSAAGAASWLSSLAQIASDHGFSMAYNATGGLVVSHSSGDITLASSSNGSVTLAGSPGPDFTALVATLDAAEATIGTALSDLGSASNRMASQREFVKSLIDTLTVGVGNLVDADMAAESARLQALQVKQQLGIQALSIANQGPSVMLNLFRG